MTKVAGVLVALLVVGIAVTTRTHAAGPACPATPTPHTAKHAATATTPAANTGHR